MRGQGSGGFTLIELMVIITILAVVAAIAIPSLLDSRKAANEASAVQILRSIHAAQTLFRDRDMDRNGVDDYAEEIGMLTEGGANLIVLDERLTHRFGTGGARNGYAFGLIAPLAPLTSRDGWRGLAAPIVQGRTGDRTFMIDESGVIRFTYDMVNEEADLPVAIDDWPVLGVSGPEGAQTVN